MLPTIAEVEMDAQKIEKVIALCRQAAEEMDGQSSFRLRTLMQMLLLELEQERAARARPVQGRSGD